MFLSLSCTEPDYPILTIKDPTPSVKRILDQYPRYKVNEREWVIVIGSNAVGMAASLFICFSDSTCLFLDRLTNLLHLLEFTLTAKTPA